MVYFSEWGPKYTRLLMTRRRDISSHAINLEYFEMSTTGLAYLQDANFKFDPIADFLKRDTTFNILFYPF